jgi:hypothetical protein
MFDIIIPFSAYLRSILLLFKVLLQLLNQIRLDIKFGLQFIDLAHFAFIDI